MSVAWQTLEICYAWSSTALVWQLAIQNPPLMRTTTSELLTAESLLAIDSSLAFRSFLSPSFLSAVLPEVVGMHEFLMCRFCLRIFSCRTQISNASGTAPERPLSSNPFNLQLTHAQMAAGSMALRACAISAIHNSQC